MGKMKNKLRYVECTVCRGNGYITDGHDLLECDECGGSGELLEDLLCCYDWNMK